MCCRLGRCAWLTVSTLLFVLAMVCFVLASLGLFFTPRIIHDRILKEEKFGLERNNQPTKVTKKWADPEYDMRFEIHVFNVTNADQINKTHTIVPLLNEKGPYTFREKRHNEYNFSSDNSQVTYKTQTFYQFDQERSCKDCSLDDYVTVPNIALQVTERAIRGNFTAALGLNAMLAGHPNNVAAFKTVTVRQLLFEGYEDELLKMIRDIFNQTIPTRIGLMMNKNGTYSAPYTIDTGSKDINKISSVSSWNSSTTTNAWYKSEARKVKGVDGALFPPKRDGFMKSFEVFVGDICRTIKFQHNKSVDFDGLNVEEYQVDRSMSDADEEQRNGYCNPDSPRFFSNLTIQPYYCAPAGLVDISSCNVQAQGFYFGQPRFYGPFDDLRQQLGGLSKWNPKDVTKILIEPQTGAVVHVQQFSQISVGMIGEQLLPALNIPPRVMPILWINETLTYDKETSNQLHKMAKTQWIIFIICILLYLIGAYIIVGLCILACCQCIQIATTNKHQRVWISQTERSAVVPPLELKDPMRRSL